jgi:hypothetical protein
MFIPTFKMNETAKTSIPFETGFSCFSFTRFGKSMKRDTIIKKCSTKSKPLPRVYTLNRVPAATHKFKAHFPGMKTAAQKGMPNGCIFWKNTARVTKKANVAKNNISPIWLCFHKFLNAVGSNRRLLTNLSTPLPFFFEDCLFSPMVH